MTIHTRDSRQEFADREFDRLVQQGVSPATASALLPALVSSNEGLRAVADDWARQHAIEGHDLSDEGQRQSRITTNAARQFVQEQMELGAFTGEPMFRPGNRYAAPEADVHAELDRITPHRGYPDMAGNRHRLALSEAEKSLPAGHTLDDDGTVRDRAGQPTGQTVRLPEPSKVVVSDGMVRNAARPDTDHTAPAFYKDAPDGDWSGLGANTPFFAND